MRMLNGPNESLSKFATARKRYVTPTSCTGLLICACLLFCSGYSSAETSSSARSWRLELDAHGGWLPGDGVRGGVGLGVGAGYSWISAGAEVWRYHLSLEDQLSGVHEAVDTTILVPLRVGARYGIGATPIVIEALAGLGVNVDPPIVKTGYCATKSYAGWLFLGRVLVAYEHRAVRVGPHLGIVHDFGLNSGSECGTGPDPDPELRRFPQALPFGVQVGISVGIGLL